MTRDEMIATLQRVDEELPNECFDLSLALGEVLAALSSAPPDLETVAAWQNGLRSSLAVAGIGEKELHGWERSLLAWSPALPVAETPEPHPTRRPGAWAPTDGCDCERCEGAREDAAEHAASPVVAPAPVERDGVRVTKAGHAWPDVPGGVAKDHAREKQPAVAYACLYQRLAQVARDHGYALAMHGSLVADLDLVAVPWAPDAVSDMVLASALAAAVPGSLHADQWTEPRPGGVKKHIIHLGGGPYLDLCVTPLAALSPRETTPGGGR